MKKQALQVTLDVREPSVVELTVGDKVQLDRLTPSSNGCVARRHGNLLEAGVATLALAPGFYYFRTLSDANLKVVRGGVNTSVGAVNKENDPTPPPATTSPQPMAKGDDAAGELPRLTVE